MKCKFCGNEINENKKFCAQCGRPVIIDSENEPENNGYMSDITSSTAAFSDYSLKSNAEQSSDGYVSYGGVVSKNDKFVRASNSDVYSSDKYNQTDNCPKIVGYKDAVRLFFMNCLNYKDRSTLSEFKKAIEAFILYNLAFLFLMPMVLGYSFSDSAETFFRKFIFITDVLMLVPYACLQARRFHDTGKSAKFLLLPYISGIFCFIFSSFDLMIFEPFAIFFFIYAVLSAIPTFTRCFKEGQKEPNEWGPVAKPTSSI